MIFSQRPAAGRGRQGEAGDGTAMAAIDAAEGVAPPGAEQRVLPAAAAPAALWAAAAREILDWLAARGAPTRDAVVLLPFAALLPPLRAALAARGGWLPRVETPQTLAAALAPPAAAPAGRCCGDPLVDGLVVAQRLERERWAQDWAGRDAAGFRLLVARVLDAVGVLRAAAVARPRAQRADWWHRVQQGAGVGHARSVAEDALDAAPPKAVEDRLLAIAVELAVQAVPDPGDRLFGLRPSAWIAVQIGGPDPLAEALLQHGGVPALRLMADPAGDDPLAGATGPACVSRRLAADAESEALAAADAVIEALDAGRAPVALVALDRMCTRRVRALLARKGVPLVDETGWRLSTSAVAVRARSRLLAAALAEDAGRRERGEAASADDWADDESATATAGSAAPPAGGARDAALEWLKAWPPARARPVALQSLEASWRGRRRVRDRAGAETLWRQAQQWLRPWCVAPAVRTLRDWLDLLASQWERDGTLADLAADAVGRQLLAALRLQPGVARPAAWDQAAMASRLDLTAFTGWLESVLDATHFDPPPDPGALVVLTPLARAIGRPFGAVVVPAADHTRLAAAAPRPALIDDRLAGMLGLEDRAAERRRQRLALAQLLRLPSVVFIRRRQHAGEPIAESPELAALRLHVLARGDGDLPETEAATLRRAVDAAPVARPQPRAPAALPDALTASSIGALRECPYRFFTRAVLRLDEPAELDAELAKRDYGNWLHLVLQHFHIGRARSPEAGEDAARLHDAAERATRELGLDPAQLLPFRASFEVLAPAYLQWLAAREADGWRFERGEADFALDAPELAPTRLVGRIDRIDRNDLAIRVGEGHGAGGPVLEVLDYKTGDAAQFRRAVADPLEDTQLAVYAALLRSEGPLHAAYLALDGRGAPQRIGHEGVQASADALLAGLGDELARLRAGAPLPALGEGAVCDRCEARGLCRRDHWAAQT